MGPGMPGGTLIRQGPGWPFPSLAFPQGAHIHMVAIVSPFVGTSLGVGTRVPALTAFLPQDAWGLLPLGE